MNDNITNGLISRHLEKMDEANQHLLNISKNIQNPFAKINTLKNMVLYESEQKIKNNYIFHASTNEELEMMYAFVSRAIDDNGRGDIRVRINTAKSEMREIMKLPDELAGK